MKRSPWQLFFLLFLSLNFGPFGCAASKPDEWKKPGKVAVFECDSGIEFVVDSQAETAWLFLPGQTVALSRVRSGSGARYSNNNISFWNKGNEAMLDLQSGKTHYCTENRSRSIWEDAKLRGVDFRAVGNEPGWHLEIGSESILLVTDYGQKEESFRTPTPVTDQQARQTTYSSDGLQVQLDGHSCRDTMSHETFETTVTLIYHGRTLNGCGKALH